MAAVSSVHGSRSVQRASVVVFDPHAGERRVLVSEIRRLGVMRVEGVGQAKEVLALINDGPVDLLVSEFEPDLVNLIRRHPKSPNPEIPIVMVTTHTSRDEVAVARDAGVDEFVAKPVSSSLLGRHIVAALGRHRRFIHSLRYAGPDRRRRLAAGFPGPDRRRPGSQGAAEDAGLSKEALDSLLDAS